MASEFVSPIFMVVVMALMSSWAISLTLLPAMCVPLLKVPEATTDDVYDTPLYEAYRRVLRACLHNRALTIAVAVALLVGAGSLFGSVRNEFFAPSDNPIFVAAIELPEGITEGAAAEAMTRLHAFIDHDLSPGTDGGGVVRYTTMLGDKLPRFVLSYKGPGQAVGTIALHLRTEHRAAVDSLVPKLQTFVETELIGARFDAGPLTMGPGGGADIAIKVTSEDETALWAGVDAIATKLRQTDGVSNVRDNWGVPVKKLDVGVDPVRVQLAGLSNQQVATSLLTSLSGVEATELRVGDDAFPILVRSTAHGALDLSALRNLTVFGQGHSVSLQQVADVDVVLDFPQIHREARVKTVEVSADVAYGVRAGDVMGGIVEWGTSLQDVVLDTSGEAAASSEANDKLMSNAPLAFLVILMLLVVQFNSFRRVLINIGVLPFAIIGVVSALLLFDAAFGFLALLAMISLFGILLNNGIVLIDRIDSETARGLPAAEAVVEASVQRVRPILMTTITTVAGLIPLYLGGGSAFEGLAVTLIGGLTGGTVLTLVLVPVAYALLFRIPTPARA